jgi:hypothetical protein
VNDIEWCMVCPACKEAFGIDEHGKWMHECFWRERNGGWEFYCYSDKVSLSERPAQNLIITNITG